MHHENQPASGRIHACPVWLSGILTSSLRRLVQNPETILRELVRPGDTAVDLGCGPGFFTLPMARLVGETGRVVGVDLQEGMLERMMARAAQAGLAARVEPWRCQARSVGYPGPADFAMAFYMVHEVPDAAALLGEVLGMLRPGGRLLLAEPKAHVGAEAWRATVRTALGLGFQEAGPPPDIFFSRTTLLERR